jgi:hypothetical protein
MRKVLLSHELFVKYLGFYAYATATDDCPDGKMPSFVVTTL